MNHGERGSGPAAALFSSSPMVAYDARPRSRATASPAFTKSKAALTQSNCSTSTCLPHLPRKRESSQNCWGDAGLLRHGIATIWFRKRNVVLPFFPHKTNLQTRTRAPMGRSLRAASCSRILLSAVRKACQTRRPPPPPPPPPPCATETRQRHVGGRHCGTITYLGSGCQQLTCAPRAVATPSLQPPRVPLGRYQRACPLAIVSENPLFSPCSLSLSIF